MMKIRASSIRSVLQASTRTVSSAVSECEVSRLTLGRSHKAVAVTGQPVPCKEYALTSSRRLHRLHHYCQQWILTIARRLSLCCAPRSCSTLVKKPSPTMAAISSSSGWWKAQGRLCRIKVRRSPTRTSTSSLSTRSAQISAIATFTISG